MENNDASHFTLSPMQQSMLFHHLAEEDPSSYIQQLVCHIGGSIDEETFLQAWVIATKRHDSLRTTFHWQADLESFQQIHPAITPSFERLQVKASSPKEMEQRLNHFLAEDRDNGVDLSAAPPWRLTWLHGDTSESVLVWTFHHILLDGRSHNNLLKEVQETYAALRAKQEVDSTPDYSFRDYINWREKQDDTSTRDFWMHHLAGWRGNARLGEAPENRTNKIHHAEARLTQEECIQLQAFADEQNVTFNTLVQAAWCLLLGRYTQQQDLVFGATRACRHWTQNDPDKQIGLFINTVPFRAQWDESTRLAPWLRTLREEQISLRPVEHTDPKNIRDWCNISGNTPLFESILVFEHSERKETSQADTAMNLFNQVQLFEKIPGLTIGATLGQDGLHLDIAAPAAQLDSLPLKWMPGHLATLLRAMPLHPKALLSDLPMITEEERALQLGEFKGTQAERADERCFFQHVEARAITHPDIIAAEWKGTGLSYAELNKAANQLARYLKNSGLRSGQSVAVCLPRDIEWAVAILAIWKAGAVYVPVDTAQSRERIEFYLTDSQAALILTDEITTANLPKNSIQRICIDHIKHDLNELDETNLNEAVSPDDLAYILYTSGSTGTPKGVLTVHRGLENVSAGQAEMFELNTSSRVIQYTAESFDVSLYEITMAWGVGATLVFSPLEEIATLEKLVDFLQKKHIHAFTLTPTVLKMLPFHPLPELQVLVCCGETCPPELPQQWAPGRRFFNAYGPTEVTIWSTTEECTADTRHPTIGRPIPNLEVFVLDSDSQLVPIGTPGELCIGGTGIATGYLNRPKETLDHFVPHPFSDEPGRQIYRTGDRVRFLSDGRIDFLGRWDNQVKIAGVRMELGEIEEIIRSHPAVHDAVTVLQDEHLSAYLIANANSQVNDTEFRRFLGDKMARYLVPKTILWLEEYPLLPSGKADRKALAAIMPDAEGAPAKAHPPLTQEERNELFLRWNDSDLPFDQDLTLPDLFRLQAEATPNAIAVSSDTGSVTYGELDARSDAIAAWVQTQCSGKETAVAVVLDRSIEAVLCFLGITKAGATYLPIDAALPPQRIAYTLENAQAGAVLTRPDLQENLPDGSVPVHLISDVEKEGARRTFSPVKLDSSLRAYIIYTSGSTGKAKGVEIEHRSLAALIAWYRHELQLTPADRTSMISSIAFDAWMADIAPYLSCGASIHIPTKETVSEPDNLVHWLVHEQISVSFVPTALAELLLMQTWSSDTPLRYLLTGGDALRGRPNENAPFTLVNTYGPTENTVDSTWGIVPPSDDHSAPPIGYPIGNVRAYILDEQSDPVRLGEKGELCLAGKNLARGYLNFPEMTDEKFPTVPCADGKLERIYRTGDRVSRLPDGQIAFHGRIDDQIQLRGFRIELGEIERILMEHPALKDVSVRPHKVDGVVKKLVAFVAPEDPQFSDRAALRDFIAERVPVYMIPSSFTLLPVLPRGISGKIKREALPEPSLEDLVHTTTGRAPESETERKLATIWEKLTGLDGLSVEDNFFELGGHSILVIKMVMQIEEAFQKKITVAAIFQNPTIANLAHILDAGNESTPSGLFAMQKSGTQRPIFCVSGAGGGTQYFQGISHHLGKDQPFYAMDLFGIEESLRLNGSVESLADHFLTLIRDIQPEGPYRIGGFSLGGIIAYEISRRLIQQNEEVELLSLIHSYGPHIWTSKRFRIRKRLLNFKRRSFRRKVEYFTSLAKKMLPKPAKEPSSPDTPKDLFLAIKLAVKMQERMLYHYTPDSIPVPMVLFCSEIPLAEVPPDKACGWGGFSTHGIHRHVMPGNHFDIAKPPCDRLIAEQIQAYLKPTPAQRTPEPETVTPERAGTL